MAEFSADYRLAARQAHLALYAMPPYANVQQIRQSLLKAQEARLDKLNEIAHELVHLLHDERENLDKNIDKRR